MAAGGHIWPPVLDAYARLRFLPGPYYEGQSENDAADDDRPPEHDLLRSTLHALALHTRNPDDCHFCLWDGWGVDIDVDPHFAGIGADAMVIEELLAHPDLDVVSADPCIAQPSYG